MVILGIDPGIAIVGYGIIEYKNNNNPLDDIEKCFDTGLSTQARSYVISKLAVKG